MAIELPKTSSTIILPENVWWLQLRTGGSTMEHQDSFTTSNRAVAMRSYAILLAALTCLTACPPPAATEPFAASTQSVSTDVRREGKTTAPLAVPQASEQALQYYRSGNILWVVSRLVGLAIPALLLFTGLSARMRSLARRIGRKWFFIVGVFFILYSLLTYLLDFPLAYYAGYVRQHAYGLSNQTFQKWLFDSLKELAVHMVFGCLLLWLPYLLIRRSPRRWWLYTSLLALPVMVFMMLIQPIWIAPLFNRFGPMKNTQLEAQILGVAHRAGIEGGRVFEVDKSVDTKMVNAYVTGLFGTKRIVLWDTLLAKLDTDQVLFVMAHEMGHYVLNHVLLGILLGFVGALIAFYLVYRLSGLTLERWKRRFGFEQLCDVASLPLILLFLQLISLALMPIGLECSRYMEHEADRFALELTRDNHAAATAFVRLQSENLGNPRPGPLYMLWRGSHPSLGERIDFANTYRPWEKGKPLRYGRLFETPSR
jgi:Zn-dependent protease with chaperone function